MKTLISRMYIYSTDQISIHSELPGYQRTHNLIVCNLLKLSGDRKIFFEYRHRIYPPFGAGGQISQVNVTD